jgi:hypothetical protein
MKKKVLIGFAFLFCALVAFTSFQAKPKVKSIEVFRTVVSVNKIQYEVIAVTIETKKKFFVGAYSMTMCIRSDSSKIIEPFEHYQLTDSKLIGYFTADVFDKMVGKKVSIYYGYQHATNVAITDFDIVNGIKPLNALYNGSNYPKLTTAVLDTIK